MKIIMHGPAAGPGPYGGSALWSWGPAEEFTFDDKDTKGVEWARGWVEAGATLVEDVAQKETKAPAAAKAEAKADVKASGRA